MAQQDKKPKGIAVVIGMGRPHPPDGMNAVDPMARRRQHAADVEAAFTGRPQPHGTFDEDQDGGWVSAKTAGYLELAGAQKTGECNLVEVAGGVSAKLGCCNLFDPEGTASSFCCGECVHFMSTPAAAPASAQAPADDLEAVNA